MQEFFAQGDKERELGIPVQMLNDREKVNIPNSQVGFIEFVVAPLIVGTVKIFPPLYEMSREIHRNLCHWTDQLVESTSPSEEEQQKLQARLEKVRLQVLNYMFLFRGHKSIVEEFETNELKLNRLRKPSRGCSGRGKGPKATGAARRRPSGNSEGARSPRIRLFPASKADELQLRGKAVGPEQPRAAHDFEQEPRHDEQLKRTLCRSAGLLTIATMR